jgi:hypothetical protein
MIPYIRVNVEDFSEENASICRIKQQRRRHYVIPENLFLSHLLACGLQGFV